VDMRSKKAFTLVELLVVISIIALLLSVLMPTLQKARQQAHKIRCGSNFHQVYLISQLYSNDYKAWIPRWVSGGGDPTAGREPGIGQPVISVIPFLMHADFFDYLKKSYGTQAKFWVCPSLVSNSGKLGFMRDSDFQGNKLPEWGSSSNNTLSYYTGIARLNGLVNMTLADPVTVPESSLSPIDGGTKVLAADLNIKWNRNWTDIDSVISHIGRASGVRLPAGGNKLQADGSVKWVQPSTMALGNTLLDSTSQGKFKHWAGHGRDYYW
jgi:prepilin-type N-terminal cleavage/methylation domain-containing protein